jgi:hypothetical protein
MGRPGFKQLSTRGVFVQSAAEKVLTFGLDKLPPGQTEPVAFNPLHQVKPVYTSVRLELTGCPVIAFAGAPSPEDASRRQERS